MTIIKNAIYFGIFGNFSQDNILYVLYPFFKFSKILAFQPVSIVNVNGKPRLVFKKFWWYYGFVLLAAYFVGYYYGIQLLQQELHIRTSHSFITYITGWVQVYSLSIMTIVDVVSSWIKAKKSVQLVYEIQAIDNAIMDVGENISYKKTRNKLLVEGGLLLSLPMSFSMVNCFLLKAKLVFKFRYCFWFICFLPIIIIMVKEFIFYNYMLLFQKKFELINDKIKKMNKADIYTSRKHNEKAKKIFVVTSILHKDELFTIIYKLSKIYTKAAASTMKVMDIFSLHLLFLTNIALFVLTIHCFNVYAYVMDTVFMSPYEIVSIIAWGLMQAWVLYLNCSICERTTKTMAETGPLLHAVTGTTEDRKLFEAVQMFSLEILHTNKNFTAAGFFNLDYKLITSIVGAVTTYLVIIIQFHNANFQGSSCDSCENKSTTPSITPA